MILIRWSTFAQTLRQAINIHSVFFYFIGKHNFFKRRWVGFWDFVLKRVFSYTWIRWKNHAGDSVWDFVYCIRCLVSLVVFLIYFCGHNHLERWLRCYLAQFWECFDQRAFLVPECLGILFRHKHLRTLHIRRYPLKVH